MPIEVEVGTALLLSRYEILLGDLYERCQAVGATRKPSVRFAEGSRLIPLYVWPMSRVKAPMINIPTLDIKLASVWFQPQPLMRLRGMRKRAYCVVIIESQTPKGWQDTHWWRGLFDEGFDWYQGKIGNLAKSVLLTDSIIDGQISAHLPKLV